MAEFLFEIGLEEVPARMIQSAEDELRHRIVDLLVRERLLENAAKNAVEPLATYSVRSFSTPRRLAVLIEGVDERQKDVTEEATGPAVKIAFKDGQPTPAAEAFARKSGVAVGELYTIQTPKGEYLSATSVRKGQSASEVIARELPKELAAIYWAKNMRWRTGSNERFVRPVLWMVCLLGDAVVPVEFGGRTAARASFGHRVLSSGEAFEVQMPASYLAQLEGEYVLADVEARRHRIRKALDHVTRRVDGARWREDEALVDTVTHLTEWPDVLLGGFEPEYLQLPEEVLVTVMRDHQKYFAVEDGAGKLAPHFLAVLNIALNEANEPIIRHGNERVLRARFNDARFFWEFDQRVPLVERVKLLENVTFQKDLGSYAAKTQRVQAIAKEFATLAGERGAKVDAVALEQAAALAKTDLTTELVKEFTELQGVIGGLYARAQGVGGVAAEAIYDQYLPASAKDAIPRSNEGALLGLADRTDTLAGMFGLGMEPTGSKDPFALRRAANAIVRILAESELPLTIADVIATAKDDVQSKLRSFFAERTEFYLRESRGFAYDVSKAVMAAGPDDVRDLFARAAAVSSARGGEDFLSVSAGFKRMKNILAQAREKGEAVVSHEGTGAPPDGAEGVLVERAAALQDQVSGFCARREYSAALESMAALRQPIDAFFTEVMVMDPDPIVRRRRLALLDRILKMFAGIADFSEIVGE